MKNLLIFLSLSSIIFAADTTFKSTSSVKNVMLGVASSNLTVEGHDGDSVLVTHNLGDKIKFIEENGTLKNELDEKDKIGMITSLFKKDTDSYVKVKVPRSALLVLGSASGDISVKDVSGNTAVATVSGNTTASNISSNLEVATTSGSATVDGVKGIFLYAGTSGDLNFKNVESIANLTTTSGSITGDLKNVTTSKISSVSGTINLTLVPGGNYSFHGKSTSGKITLSSPLIKNGTNGSEVTGTVGDGTHKLEIKTTSGSITLK